MVITANGVRKYLAGQHSECAVNEKRATAKAFNGPERDRCRAHIDESRDQRNQEGVLDRAELSKEDSAEIEDEIHSSPLLHHLK